MDQESSSNDSGDRRVGEATLRRRKWYRKRARDANFKRQTDVDADGDSSNESVDAHPYQTKRRNDAESDDNEGNVSEGPPVFTDNEGEQFLIDGEAGIPDHVISDSESLSVENVQSAGDSRESNGEVHSSSQDDHISMDDGAAAAGEESEENANGDNDQNSTSPDHNAASDNENADGDQNASEQENSEGGLSETDGSERISGDEVDSESELGEDLSDYEEENEELNFEDEMIFNGSTLTFKESALAILSFVLHHRLSGLCIGDLLLLLSLHCGPGNRLLNSLYKLKKYFKMLGKEYIKMHYFCSICETPLPSKDAICHGQQGDSYFIEFPLVGQLQSLFSKPGFYEKLQYRFTREKKNVGHLEDIYDGSIYQDVFNSGFLRDPNNVSFLMYFDGVSIFKSSNFSIWPVFLTINELKFKYRTQKENTLLAALWFGKKKPNPNIFLAPVRDSLSSLENNGVDMTLPNGDNIRVRGKILCAVADMPAKALFMRFIQYNGAFSCFHCLAEGGRFDLGNASVQVFPYARHLELRNLQETVQFGDQALAARQHDPDATVYGVKGPSVLSAILPNMILCVGIDVMHGVFLGVMRTLMLLWFDGQYSNMPFSISNMAHIVDERLKKIKPPSSFQNMPRRIKDIARWKAFDLKMFFFYYSLVVLCGILPEVYWFHHVQLVTAISLLSQESISPEELDSAEEMLHLYVSDFQRLYGLRHLTLTFHQLLHLVLVCKNLGPTWVYSCFIFESLNGQIAKLVHGSRHVALQICSSSFIFMKLPVLVNSMPAGEAKTLCLKFLEPTQKAKVTEVIDQRAGVVGKFKVCNPTANVRRLFQEEFNIIGGRYSFFARLKLNGLVYNSAQYVRSKQKRSCFVEIFERDNCHLCKVLSFIRWSPCGDNCPVPCAECPKHYFCLVSIYDRDLWELHDAPLDIIASHLQRVLESDKCRIFPIQSIKSLCLYMSVNDKEYISVPINNFEVE